MWSRISRCPAVAGPSAASRLPWPGLRLFACLTLAIVAYRELFRLPKFGTLEHGLRFWLFEPSYTWAPLVVAGSVWLLYRRREHWVRLPARRGPAVLAAGLLLLGASFYAWAWLTGATDLLVPSLMANALGVACLMKGVGGCRLVLLPVLFLLFAWPLPPPLLNELVWQLQLWTAAVAGGLLRAVGVPALVETTIVSRPDYSFAVIENCSGLRSMELLTAIALIVRERVPGAGTRSWLVVLVAPLVAALLNTLRIFVVVVSPNPHAVNDHLVQGILVLVAGTLALHVCARRLCVGPRPPSAVVDVSHPERSAPAMFPWRTGMAALLALSVVSLLPSPWRSAAAPPPRLRERIPVEHAGWVVKSQQRDVQFLGAVRFRESLSRLYSRGGEAVALFVAAAAEGNRRTSPFSPKTVLPGMRWRLERSDVARLEALGIAVESAVVELDGERWLVYHWRRGDAGLLAETLRHGLAIDETPLTGGRERAVLRLATPVGAALPDERARAADTLERFTRDFREFLSGPRPPTARALRRAGDSPV